MRDSSADEYFHAIEETFIRLRGAPLLLSPADWQTARTWYEAGIPRRLVERVLEEVFSGLRERDPERRIHSLRYCASAVEEAWREVRDLGATAGRLEPVPIDVTARLEVLVRRLPADLPGGIELAATLDGLAGEAEAVETRLQEIEEEFLNDALEELPSARRRALSQRVERAIARARPRMSEEDAVALEARLLREYTRQELDLPPLSLFVEPPPSSADSSAPAPSSGED